MTAWFFTMAVLLLLSLGGALFRIWRGPHPADRMMAAQLVGTGGVGTVLLLSAATGWAMIDVALVLALLAAFASVAFVKTRSGDGSGDPEEAEPGRAEDAGGSDAG